MRCSVETARRLGWIYQSSALKCYDFRKPIEPWKTTMSKKKHNKPVGKSGSLRMRSGLGIDEKTFERYIFPKEKDLIEADIATAFRNCVMKQGHGELVELFQLEENDLDFRLEVDGDISKLEFTELVLSYPPYQENEPMVTIWYRDWADKLLRLVGKKNEKNYSDQLPIDLLVYTTDVAYHGNDPCVDLGRERLRHAQAGRNFRNIWYLEYRKETSVLYPIKPYPPKMAGTLRRELESHWASCANFEQGAPVPGGMMFAGKFPKR